MIAEELLRIWTTERTVVDRRPYEGLRVPSVVWNIYAGVDPRSDRRFVAWRLSREHQRAIQDRRPRSSKGILVESMEETGEQVLVLTEQPGAPLSVFPAVMSDVIEVAAQAASLASLRCAFERFASWQRALQRRTGPMGPQEVRGVIGELITFRDVVMPALGVARGLERWTALSDDDLNDFGGPGWFLEVKTILAWRSMFHISALGQLEPPPTGCSWLSLVELEQANDGISLTMMMESLLESTNTDPTLRQALQDAFVARGAHDPGLDGEADVRYRVLGLRTFGIEVNFPLLRRAQVPRGVARAEYDIEISACAAFEVGPTTVVEELRNWEGAL